MPRPRDRGGPRTRQLRRTDAMFAARTAEGFAALLPHHIEDAYRNAAMPRLDGGHRMSVRQPLTPRNTMTGNTRPTTPFDRETTPTRSSPAST
ncbi:hypothetical protein ACIA8E_36715 [Streptomyces sp. NPDC051664]|uniref:hypothetical protein n=1 Tax=Streptomyces sp. NPDC051664 TaxID=3365668 RepID=UPI003795B566